MSKRLIFLICRFVFYALIILSFMVIPVSFVEQRSICLINFIFGIKCFTCGVTRGVSNFFHGNFLRAWEFNPLTYIVIALFFTVFVSDMLLAFRMAKNCSDRKSIFEKVYTFIFPENN